MTGWNEYGHAVPTGLPVDAHLGQGDLQDAENCGYAPVSVLAELGVDTAHGDPQVQFRDGRIVLLGGAVLERGGTLNCVWAVTRLPDPFRCICDPDDVFDPADGPTPRAVEGCPAHGARHAYQRLAAKPAPVRRLHDPGALMEEPDLDEQGEESAS